MITEKIEKFPSPYGVTVIKSKDKRTNAAVAV